MEDRSKLKEFIKFLRPKALKSELVNDIIDSFGGSLLSYQMLLSEKVDVENELKSMKESHTANLRAALDLNEGQTFSELSMKRYELLKAVERGEKIISRRPAAKYLLAKHGKVEAFLGIHPEKYFVFALPMTKFSLKQLEPEIQSKKL